MEHIGHCGSCGGRFKVDVKHVGRRVKCPKCGEITTVSAEPASGEPAAGEPAAGTPAVAPHAPPAPPISAATPADRIHVPSPPGVVPSGDDAVTAPDLSELADLTEPSAKVEPPSIPTYLPPGTGRSRASVSTGRGKPTAPLFSSALTRTNPVESDGFKIHVEPTDRPATAKGGARSARPGRRRWGGVASSSSSSSSTRPSTT